MLFSTALLSVAPFVSLVTAYPQISSEWLEERNGKFSFAPVPPGGVRSPCPGSNTLANHGFINRDGKNITKHAYQQGFLNAFNIGFNVTQDVSTLAFRLCKNITGAACTSLDLDMISVPHRIEHDASMTRDDKEMISNPDANNAIFNMTIWQTSLDIIGNVSHIDTQVANTVRLRRQEQAAAADVPGWFIATNALAEHTFYLTAMNDPALGQDPLTNPQARLDWVSYWFENERLPSALGWVKPSVQLTNLVPLQSIISQQPTIPASTASGSSTTSATSTLTTALSTTATSTTATSTTATSTAPAKQRRGIFSLEALPTLVQGKSGASAVSAAARYATAVAPAAPRFPNLYEGTTPEEFGAVVAAADKYVEVAQRIFTERLGELLAEK